MTQKEFDQMTPAEQMAEGLLAAKSKLDEQEEYIAKLKLAIEIMKPKAEYFDNLVEKNLLKNIGQTAQEMGLTRRAFIDFLVEKGYARLDEYGDIQPVDHMNDGLFEVKTFKYINTRDEFTKVLITPKGRETFRLLCRGLGE